MPLQFRRGLSSNRTSITPAQGEPIYTTDTKAIYIGDGVTAGGIAFGGGTVTSINFSAGNGITVSGAPVTTSGTVNLGLGSITPSSVTSAGPVTGSNLSGTNTGDQSFSATGDVTASSSTSVLTTIVTRINGQSLAALSTGILKNTTGTGVPSIAVASDFPTLNQNTTGTAQNVTGVVAVANGGTGAVTASDARTALGLAIGTDVLAPNGSAAGLTGFPTFNQNTTGTAANVTGVVAVANGGTGATSVSAARTALGLVIGTDVLAPNGSAANLTSFPTFNQNTTGTAANVTGVVSIANGGTGSTTQSSAANAILPAQTGNSGKYLTTDGSDVSWSTIGSGGITASQAIGYALIFG